MTQEKGKVLDFSAFRDRRRSGQEAQVEDDAVPINPPNLIEEPVQGDVSGNEIVESAMGAWLFAQSLRKNRPAGVINPQSVNRWGVDLNRESLEEIIERVLDIDEKKVREHPAYAEALFSVLESKMPE